MARMARQKGRGVQHREELDMEAEGAVQVQEVAKFGLNTPCKPPCVQSNHLNPLSPLMDQQRGITLPCTQWRRQPGSTALSFACLSHQILRVLEPD